MNLNEIKTDIDSTWYTRILTDNKELTYSLTNFRNERTGLHGVLSIKLDNIPLVYSECNIMRHEDRIRLSNAAYKHFTEGQKGNLPK